MRGLRVVTLLTITALLVACGGEANAAELTTKGVANLQSVKTVHLDGTGAIAVKGQNGVAFSLEFKLAGDADLPAKAARMNVQLALLGMSFNVDTITIDGREFTKDAASGKWTEGSKTSPVNGLMDPLGNIDPSLIHDVVEVDRPQVDGRRTRHLRYQADTARMAAQLGRSADASSRPIVNPQGTGELWIRIDDSQIVRQLVTVSMEVEALAPLLPASASNVGAAGVELSLDMRFSHHGEPVPQITAPPLGR